MTDKAKKVNVVTKSRMLLGGKLVDAGTPAEISQEMYIEQEPMDTKIC